MEEISKKNSRASRNIGMNSSMDSRPDKRFMKSAIGSRAVNKKIFLLLSLFVLCLTFTSCKKANNISGKFWRECFLPFRRGGPKAGQGIGESGAKRAGIPR